MREKSFPIQAAKKRRESNQRGRERGSDRRFLRVDMVSSSPPRRAVTVGFYLRKAFQFGPFRLNISKSGIGFSFGVKGLRFGIGPKGRYFHIGRGGIYYRSRLPDRLDDRIKPGRNSESSDSVSSQTEKTRSSTKPRGGSRKKGAMKAPSPLEEEEEEAWENSAEDESGEMALFPGLLWILGAVLILSLILAACLIALLFLIF